MDKEKIINHLNHLLNRNYDAESGFVEAANHINSTPLNRWFQENSLQRYRFGKEIKAEIRNLGGTPDKGTSLLGEMHQFWMDLKSHFTGNDEPSMLEEAIRGEEKALEDYRLTLDNTALPLSTKLLLQDHQRTIESNIRTMRRMLKVYETTPV
jgi:uncharacterized protein (TIGR02284 family)